MTVFNQFIRPKVSTTVFNRFIRAKATVWNVMVMQFGGVADRGERARGKQSCVFMRKGL